jgi:shikimate dehydrogenase
MNVRPGRLVLLGHPIAHSLSPRFQNAALRAAGSTLRYMALDVPPHELASVVRALVADHAAGNVTVPHKQAFAALCDRRTALAERVGAVNTFWVDGDGALVGDNTDVGGFDASVRQLLGAPPGGRRVALLGAGGAAAAVLAAIECWGGCDVTICNRTRERADRLAARFPVVTGTSDSAAGAVHDAAIVVNATTVGLHDDLQPVPIDALPCGVVVVDLVYRPGGTPWVRAARACGVVARDGLAMLVEQGALSFERWFGMEAPRDVMRQALQP